MKYPPKTIAFALAMLVAVSSYSVVAHPLAEKSAPPGQISQDTPTRLDTIWDQVAT